MPGRSGPCRGGRAGGVPRPNRIPVRLWSVEPAVTRDNRGSSNHRPSCQLGRRPFCPFTTTRSSSSPSRPPTMARSQTERLASHQNAWSAGDILRLGPPDCRWNAQGRPSIPMAWVGTRATPEAASLQSHALARRSDQRGAVVGRPRLQECQGPVGCYGMPIAGRRWLRDPVDVREGSVSDRRDNAADHAPGRLRRCRNPSTSRQRSPPMSNPGLVAMLSRPPQCSLRRPR
ncbi:MAG: hypothetical protein K0S88_2261 [Actinomycetia bacterium]|nr:hypothetical protein [Actinomycetes bacterium]